MSEVFRFHGPTNLPPSQKATLLRKRKRFEADAPVLVGADFSSFTDAVGTSEIETFQDRAVHTAALTRRESDLIALANPGSRAPAALEDDHPWLPNKPFLNDSVASFGMASSLVRRYGGHLVSAAAYCDEKWSTICNALRRKSDLDARFYTAWHLPIQDVYVLEERRPDRTVIAIDFNGMYPACMQHAFPKPSSLKLVHYDRPLEPDEDLLGGLYRCVLDGPTTEFIRSYNPFRSFFSGRHLRAGLNEPIKVDLNEFEVDYYRRHFRTIHLVDAVVSDSKVHHPLAKEVRRSFARRKNYRAQGNKPLADREKYLATLMSSCANRPTRARRTFGSRDEALAWLGTTYGIRPPEDEPEIAVDTWLRGRKGINLNWSDDGVTVDGPDLQNGSACFLLGQRIVARGRIVLLGMMEKVLELSPDVQITYTNIDSVHFSIPTEHLDQVMRALNAEASEEMGSFKIEVVTSHGLWLEPGRYWLYSDVVEKFRNRSVGDRQSPFRDHATYVASRQIGDLHIPIKASVRMDRSMSDVRALVEDPQTGLRRQHLIEVDNATTFTTVLDQLTQNQKRCTRARIAAFAALKQSMDHPAALP